MLLMSSASYFTCATDDQVYEDVERLLHRSSTRKGRPDSFERNAPARRSVIMDVFSKSGSLHRALWCEMPEVSTQ